MKYRPLLSLVFLSLCAVRAEALSEKGQQALKQLQTALVEEAKAEKPSNTPNEMGSRNIKQSMLPRVQEVLANVDSPQWLESMGQIIVYYTAEAVTKNYAILRAEKEAANQAALAKITASIDKAGQAVRAAKTAADLDATIAELTPLRQRYNRGQISEELQAAYAQVEPVLQFVNYWQNYLAAKSIGAGQQAREALQTLLGNSGGPYLIPRSELLALNAPSKAPIPGTPAAEQADPRVAVQKIIDETKSLADIEEAMRKLAQVRSEFGRANMDAQPANGLMESLRPIDKSYQEFKAGLAVNIDLANNYNGGPDLGNGLVARLKSELLILVLPRYVGAPDETAAKPGEDVLHFLNRLTVEAKDRGDVNVATRGREALRLLLRGASIGGDDINALRAFVSGQNQETAGQYSLAVISYQTALKSGSDLVPAKVIGERLAAIETEHPKEFASGMERYLNPPQPRPDYNLPPGMRPDGTFFRGNPNAPQQPAAGPALAIPPAPVSSATPVTSVGPDTKKP